MKNRTQTFLENGIYALIWIVVLAVPLLGYNTDTGIHWEDVKRFWLNILPFFILFIVNNYLLIPRFLGRKRYAGYAISLAVFLMVLFLTIPILRGGFSHPGPPPVIERRDRIAPDYDEMFPVDRPEPGRRQSPPPPEGKDFREPGRPMPIRWGPMLNDWLLAILLVGFNVAIYLMFRSIRDAQRMKELESRRLQSELDYLKAQVNPHFFMNTLNNIHALIDIDTEKAKDSLVELSRIMRYVLYDADRPLIPLDKELEISTRYPECTNGVHIPPLLLITLLENAFKHGVNHDAGSYIHTGLTLADGYLSYTVRNRADAVSPAPGVGLDNLRKRLELLYRDKYVLETVLAEDEYIASIHIPVDV